MTGLFSFVLFSAAVLMASFYLFSLLTGAQLVWAVDYTSYVRTDTGSVNGGNTFPGVSKPGAMVKLGPDLDTGKDDAYSGYLASGRFTGFSMLHESGTGGAPKYGVVSQLPLVGPVEPLKDNSQARAAPDQTEVGYYKASLESGITVELTASDRSGKYWYTFPDPGEAAVLVDVSHVLPSYRGMGLGQRYLGGSIAVEGDGGDLRYTGSGTYDNGWNRAAPWTVYFCGTFDAPATYKTFLGDGPGSNKLAAYDATREVNSSDARLGAVFTFSGASKVQSTVGVSFISTSQACDNAAKEIPTGRTFSDVRDEVKSAWNSQVLSKVTSKDQNAQDKLTQLYTALYFTSLLPTNKTGENPLWDSGEPYYDDTFTLWDLFRCTTSLFHVLQPDMYEEYIRSLIDIQKNEGFMPDARSSFSNGATQGGSNADNVLADAYVKGVRGKINWDEGYAAMQADAEVEPPNNNDPRDPSCSTKEGRGALPDWLEHGFITPKYGASVTRAVEYSCNDFGLYQVASGLGRDDEAKEYLGRSRNWRNQWNPDMEALGFKGFLAPRDTEGFIEQDPLSCGGCYWGNEYYEALPWEYSMNAHHDMESLIYLAGGEDEFVARLEKTFEPGANPNGDARFNKTIFNPGNEPSFTTPFLFNYVGRQDLTVKYSRANAKAYFSATPAGLPGNSDAGAMESWLIWVMLGLYPMTGQTTFLIGSPWFADLSVDLEGGKKLHVTTSGGGDDDAFYVQSLKVNGKDWTKAWVTWADVFAEGGTMEYVLGPEPVRWATGPPPPSPASEGGEIELPYVRTRKPA